MAPIDEACLKHMRNFPEHYYEITPGVFRMSMWGGSPKGWAAYDSEGVIRTHLTNQAHYFYGYRPPVI